jgi:hypothetical protein
MLITYVTKSSGQIDEQVQVVASVKERDITTCNIILDFQKKVVDTAHVDGTQIPKDWDKIVDYYKKIYPDVIDDLEKSNTDTDA